MLDILNNHKTIRKYTDKKIDKDTLDAILNAGCRASTTGNMQLYSVVVTEKEENKAILAPFHFNQPMIKAAPIVLTICADFNRFNIWCRQRNAEPGYDNFLSFVTAAVDAMLVAQNIAVAAEAKGLGICYLGTTIYMAKQIIEALELPRGVVPITTITVGYPDEAPKQIDRLPLESIVHYESYKDYTAADIDKYYAHKEAMEENKAFVAENNKETLAQVFTDVRYKKADNETFSNALLDVLKQQGF